MLILDSGGTPSPFFTKRCRDKSVRYFHAALPPPTARTVGGKRNWLSKRAKGSVLVAFDDDDVYCPEYVQRMCQALLRDGADLIKLASWMVSVAHVPNRVFA